MSTTKTFEQLGQEIEAAQAGIGDLVNRITAASSSDDVKSVQADVASMSAQLAELTQERDTRLRQVEMDGVKSQITSLEGALRDLAESSRISDSDFQFAGGVPLGGEKSVYAKGERSYFGDIVAARAGDQKAVTRLKDATEKALELEGKAMTEGTDTAGGFLVRPHVVPGLLAAKERLPSITNLIPRVRVNTDSIEFVSVTSGLQAGWVAELASKPSGDLAFSTLQASVFTAAGLAVVSNQLLADSSIDQLIAADLLKRYNNVVAKGILYGDGNGKPLGLLNQTGRNTITYTDASPTVVELLAKILEAIVAVQENNLSEPTHIVLKPSTWTKIITDADAKGVYTLGSDGLNRARTAADALPGRSLFGYPVLLEGNMPADRGAGTNETAVIVADFSETLLMEREDFSVDKSEHVYFTSNQTVFRGEGRVGFTAARHPKAVSTVEGTGLIGF